MTRIAVAEDDPAQMERLHQYLERFSSESGEVLAIDEFCNGGELLFHYQPVYDVILLDIEMPHVDGMEAARIIREQDTDAVIIFITNMAQYAIQGYKVRAQSYILKPVSYYSLLPELQEAIKTAKKRAHGVSLLLSVDGSMVKVPVQEIRYIESKGHNLTIHTSDGTHIIRETMKSMCEKLAAEPFALSTVSYLVNLAHVSHVGKTEAIVGTERVPISRQKYKEFLAALTNYIGSART